MLIVNYAKWGHKLSDLRMFAQDAPHHRTRERFLALYDIARGKSATRVARLIGRNDETVHGWVHQYNKRGTQALIYRRTGGRPPFVRRSPQRLPTSFCRPRSCCANLG
jgi:transposase